MTRYSQLIISQTDSRPMYQQLVDQISRRVASGDWQAGDELPSIRSLAASTKVSLITVKRAYAELERLGMIVTRHGKGSFVAKNANTDIAQRRRELETQLSDVARLADQVGLSNDELHALLDRMRFRGGGQK